MVILVFWSLTETEGGNHAAMMLISFHSTAKLCGFHKRSDTAICGVNCCTQNIHYTVFISFIYRAIYPFLVQSHRWFLLLF